jgi:tetrahydromethanopterin:alpha-L-glutamate ligase
LRRDRHRARIVLITTARDRHARQLRAAFLRRDVEAVLMPLEACVFDTVSPSGLRLGKFDGLPDGVFVRTIAEGSFEAVTRRLGILHALRALGVPVWNEAAAIERCVDKSTTTFLLARAALPVPATWTVEGIEAARRIVASEASLGPLVLKPLFGAQGRGLMLIREAAELPRAETVGDVYYLQRFVGGDGPDYRDFRVFVIQGEPVAAMVRHSHQWITNVKRGGHPLATRLDRELAALASEAARAVGAAFCGVDIIRDKDHRPNVLEVNSMPAWSGLQTVASVQIADLLAERFIRALHRPTQVKVA